MKFLYEPDDSDDMRVIREVRSTLEKLGVAKLKLPHEQVLA